MSRKNIIQSVCGPITPSEVNLVLPHEHILIDAEPLYVAPPAGREKGSSLGFELSNLGWIRYFPYSHKDNLHLNSAELALKELVAFKKQVGEGATIVDVTTEGIRSTFGRRADLLALKQISKDSGVNIICGCGYYIGKSHPKEVESLSVDELAKQLVNDVQGGDAGVIGEIGCSWPLLESEKKVLEAASRAQMVTGAPLIIHPGRDKNAPLQIIEILKEKGANLKKTVMSHLDRTVSLDDIPLLQKIADTGVFLEFDLFGVECSYYQQNENVDMVNIYR
jgi:phosphotriesterase-related protein